MFPEVTAEHPFPEYPPLLQLLFGWSGFDEGLQKPQHLAVFLTHCTNAHRLSSVTQFTLETQIQKNRTKILHYNSEIGTITEPQQSLQNHKRDRSRWFGCTCVDHASLLCVSAACERT